MKMCLLFCWGWLFLLMFVVCLLCVMIDVYLLLLFVMVDVLYGIDV